MADAESDENADAEAGDAATVEPETKVIETPAAKIPVESLEAPAIDYVGEDETVGGFLARAARESRDELRGYLSEGRTDRWLAWLDSKVDVPYVPDTAALRVLDWLVPDMLLELLDIVLFGPLAADGTSEAAEEE